ncbi:hypothetical protein SCUP515_05970 [Seiridium cupressi]
MADRPVFRFPISGRKDEYFLVQVIPTQGTKTPLDLRLLGTESTAVYGAKLRHRRVQEWKDSPGHCTNEEWEQILIATFIEPTSADGKGIEIKVDIEDNVRSTATLTFRKNIEGITQRLGSITLEEPEAKVLPDGTTVIPDELQIFDWCVAAIGDREKVVNELAVAAARVEELEKATIKLKAQLEDLLKAKEDDEHQLFAKFRDLLNEKKLKIRQQQRLIASADVDPVRLENVSASQNSVRKVKASRGGKRKASGEQEEDSDGFEQMDVDEQIDIKEESEGDPELDARQTTDEESEDATASEAEVNEEPQPIAQKKGKGQAKASAKGKAAAKPAAARGKNATSSSRNTRGTKGKSTTPPTEADIHEDDEPPPRRTLPFQSKRKGKTPEPAKAGETDSDDDEL